MGIAAGFALLSLGWLVSGAFGHSGRPPPPPATPPPNVKEIPKDDRAQYRSYVTSISPRVPGLTALIVGRQTKLKITWIGRTPLIVEGTQGEPMVRMSAKGVEINELSPSAYLSAERYGRVPIPADVDPNASPRWRKIESPGPISWYEHRAQWMKASRPAAVGDGARAVGLFHWQVPARLGTRQIRIRGALDWLPDPAAIREERSEVSSPLLSALILIAALAVGALVGVFVRRRLDPDAA